MAIFYSTGHTDALVHAIRLLHDAGVEFVPCPDRNVTHLLLPVPSFDPDGRIKGGCSLEALLWQLPEDVTVIGGGLGVAIAYPQAKALHDAGAEVDLIVGFRNEHLIILKDELEAACTNLIIMTDDGSNGNKGFVTQALQKQIEDGRDYDTVIAIGPLPMMKAVSEMTRPLKIKTIVSMNPIMIDGTGMCGGCRLTVGGETKFACVDGPDFDGHLVDFDEAMARGRMFRPEEAKAREKHLCRLTGEAR